ncbi:glycosyltransferase family 2 protein [Limibaculum sp. FT325]|uniref:glycosyltransferase family 2 protein n=1 Tax=Thermohalobaculum sediminis TaxID=2939436 RepID=UPI0020C0BEFA|nr:glycosyltransferase family 2 protein [Limibaculum sediminis]MCL5778824.1 glycosyltransferase family 2 protein [Limibaculum sediminis]
MALVCLIVLTRDEEANLPALIESARGLDAELHVVDSGSTDRTVEIAAQAGAQIHRRPWKTYADQFNWALGSIATDAPWTMRMDADERFTPGLVSELNGLLATLPAEVSGLRLRRQVWFWGRWIRHGGYYPIWLLRVWRTGMGRVEDRWMDEHVILSAGREFDLAHDIIDENRKGLGFWTAKHNGYADREVEDILSGAPDDPAGLSGQARRTRLLKNRLYLRLPLFFRAWAYWMYRYVLRGGFRDGIPGLVFHFLQGFWYRFLVDAKLVERRRLAARDESGR